MKTDRITLESILFLLAFAVALGVRLYRLGAAPLSDLEADWALQALNISRGEVAAIGPAPGYVTLTGLTFFIFGSSNFTARLWPALVGSLLILAPILFRQTLGRASALILAFGLALDPGLVAISRLAGGAMLATGWGLLALGLWKSRKPVFAGISAGFALLGGPSIIQGALGLALAWAAVRYLGPSQGLDPFASEFENDPSSGGKRELQTAIYAVGVTVLVAGTLFLLNPGGLGALAGTIPAYLAGWVEASGISASRQIAALVVYQPLALIFGVFAGVRAWRRVDWLPRWLSLWLASALLLTILYPGRQASDLAWVVLPLWALASLEIGRHLQIYEWERVPAFGQAALIVVLLALAWINLAGLSHTPAANQASQLRWAVIGGTLALGGVSAALVALGWSPVVAERGLAWGTGLALGLYVLAALWGAAQLRPYGQQELWRPVPAVRQADLLLNTLSSLSIWRTGHADDLDVLVTAPEPSLRWLLRDWRQVRFVTNLGPGELPSAIITTVDQSQPQLAVSYRGQDFSWWVSPGWDGALPTDWARWLVFREAPQVKENLILWARGDLFPDGSLLPLEEEAPAGIEGPAQDDEFVPGQGP